MEAICGQFTQIQGFNCFPISNLGSAWGAICWRGDLDPKNAMADGCYDAKISDLTMARERRALAVNGPTPGTGLQVERRFQRHIPLGNLGRVHCTTLPLSK